MAEIRYLDLEDLLSLTRLLCAGPVRDAGLLDSAAVRPRTTVFGSDAYETVPLKAAAMLHSIAKNHALVDGNKRLAWVAALTFAQLNGMRPDLTHDEAFDLVMAVASGELDDVADIAARLRLG